MRNTDMSQKFRELMLTKTNKDEGIKSAYEFKEKGKHPNVSFWEYSTFYLIQFKGKNIDILGLSIIIHCFICSRFFDESKSIKFSKSKQFNFKRDENFNSLCTKIRELYPEGKETIEI